MCDGDLPNREMRSKIISRRRKIRNSNFEIRISSNSNFFNFFFLLRFHSKLTSSHIYEIIFIKFMCDEDLSNREIRSRLTSQEKKFEIRISNLTKFVEFVFFIFSRFRSPNSHIYEIILIKIMCDGDLPNR